MGDLGHRDVIVRCGHYLTLNLVLLADVLLAEKSSPGFVVLRGSRSESIVLIIYLKKFISDFNGSHTVNFTMAIYVFECIEVHFLFLQDAFITQLIPRLFIVELALKDRDFVVKSLKLMDKVTFIFFHPIYFLLPLGSLMGVCCFFDVLFPGFCIKITCHEVLVGMEVLIKVDNLFECNLVRPTLHSLFGKLPCLFLTFGVEHFQVIIFDQ